MAWAQEGRPFTNLAALLSFVSHLSSKIVFVCCLDILQENLEYKVY